jgi:hypothetical protein
MPRKRIPDSPDLSLPENLPAPLPPDPPPTEKPFHERPAGIEEIEDFRDGNSIDSIIGEYIAKEHLVETEYRASLYKYDKVNKQKQSLIDSTVGSLLSAHDIGMAYGSGEYRYLVTWPNKFRADGTQYIRAFRINIAESYDLKRALTNPPPLPGQVAPIQPTQNPIEAALQIVGAIVQLQQGGPLGRSTAPSADIVSQVQQQQIVEKMMMQSSMQYVEFMREMRKRMMSIDGEQYEEEGEDEDMDENDNELVKTVKELAVTFLPKLLGNGPGAKIAAAAVRSTPQFKRIQKNPVTAAHLLSELEKDFGKEKVDAVCERLKIKRP